MLTSGPAPDVALWVKAIVDSDPGATILIFEDATGRQVDFDLRGSEEEVRQRLVPESDRSGPGRPKLGVVAREVTLLPRHWEWLAAQPGGASVALRKLVEQARKSEDPAKAAAEATSRFLSAIAGNLPNYEEATRALYAGDHDRFAELMGDWPHDIRTHALKMAAGGGASEG